MNDTLHRRIVKTRVKLLKKSPFFGTLILNAPIRVSTTIPTMATDGNRLLINENFVNTLSDEEFQSVMLHEVLHMALQHISRLEDLWKVDPLTTNIAADIVVNGIITDNGMKLPSEAIQDNKLKHLSVREIYSILKQKQQQQQPQQQPQSGSGSGSGSGSPNECLRPDLKEQSDDGEPGENGNQHSATPPQTNWRDVLNKAATIARAKKAGVMGAGLKRIFQEFLEPTIDWRTILYRFITAARVDFEGFDRRFISQGMYLDDFGGSKINILAFMDTSGSVDEKLLGEFISELRAAVSSQQSISGELFYFDVDIYPQGDIKEIFETPKLVGGGGTSFKKVMRMAKKASQEDLTTKTLCIIFTDGYASMSDWKDPECPVLWCVAPGGVESESFPIGEVARITR